VSVEQGWPLRLRLLAVLVAAPVVYAWDCTWVWIDVSLTHSFFHV
jgi:hypothetical protein